MTHIPVLMEGVLHYLDVQPNDTIFDGTLGMGGHAHKVIEQLNPSSYFIGCDKDPSAIQHCTEYLKHHPNRHLIHGSYADITDHLADSPCEKCNKILIDCGLSSVQLNDSSRGFSFQAKDQLDMRMDTTQTKTASHILNTYSATELKFIFETYGDVYPNDRLIETICHTRKTAPFTTTDELVQTIKKSYYFHNNRKRYINMCSRIFQALRIEVNQELDDLKQFLNSLEHVLVPNGRVVIITFHSTEDRLVKHFFKQHIGFQSLGKVIKPTQTEIKQNSRSRSAKVRGYLFAEKPMKDWKKKAAKRIP